MSSEQNSSRYPLLSAFCPLSLRKSCPIRVICVIITVNQVLVTVNQVFVTVNQVFVTVNQVLVTVNQVLVTVNQELMTVILARVRLGCC